jgi:hypothetical protein
MKMVRTNDYEVILAFLHQSVPFTPLCSPILVEDNKRSREIQEARGQEEYTVLIVRTNLSTASSLNTSPCATSACSLLCLLERGFMYSFQMNWRERKETGE